MFVFLFIYLFMPARGCSSPLVFFLFLICFVGLPFSDFFFVRMSGSNLFILVGQRSERRSEWFRLFFPFGRTLSPLTIPLDIFSKLLYDAGLFCCPWVTFFSFVGSASSVDMERLIWVFGFVSFVFECVCFCLCDMWGPLVCVTVWFFVVVPEFSRPFSPLSPFSFRFVFSQARWGDSPLPVAATRALPVAMTRRFPIAVTRISLSRRLASLRLRRPAFCRVCRAKFFSPSFFWRCSLFCFGAACLYWFVVNVVGWFSVSWLWMFYRTDLG